jgi:hypothetical protein
MRIAREGRCYAAPEKTRRFEKIKSLKQITAQTKRA